jgi:phosphatidylinositol-bisphosphatase
MVDLNVTNVALGSQSAKRSKEWINHLDITLNQTVGRAPGAAPGERYEYVGSRFLVGLLIAVFVKAKHRPALSAVRDAEAPVGVMGLMGNKGGTSVRFRLYDSTFCFVCAHLAAHRGAVQQRNADFYSILAKTAFGDDPRLEGLQGGARPAGAVAADLARTGIMDHDFVFWFGDFNYRIDEAVQTERCFELAYGGEKELSMLAARDQLNTERANGRVFGAFDEMPLSFRPTYKFQAGTSLYEQRPDKKLRAPAWCDRVLWSVQPTVDPAFFTPLYYGSVDELVSSDHKPVSALFECAAKSEIPERREAVIAEISRRLDAIENRAIPIVAVSEMAVHLPQVIYSLPQRKTITLRNTGEVAAAWRFIPKPEEKWFCKTWLRVDPAYGMLEPGEAVELTLSVTVDDAVARDISLGREVAASTVGTTANSHAIPHPTAYLPSQASGTAASAPSGGVLEDLLVLRVERGRDHYISVAATVLPTCFGCSLAQLARRPEPMRAIALTAATSAALYARQQKEAQQQQQQPGSTPVPDLTSGSNMLASLITADDSDAEPAGVSDGFGSSIGPSDETKKGSAIMSIPKELWRLVDTLLQRYVFSVPLSPRVCPHAAPRHHHPLFLRFVLPLLWCRDGLTQKGLFMVAGDPADALEIREALDTGDPVPATVDLHAVAQTVLDFLGALREPVVPTAFFPGPISDFKNVPLDSWCLHMFRQLAPLHYNVLVYVIRFGREILAHAGDNGLTAEDLAYSFSRVMFRRTPHDEAPAHVPIDVAGQAGNNSSSAGSRPDSAAVAAAESTLGGAASFFADKGTRWEPSREEQESMTKIMAYLFTSAKLS